MQHVPRVLQKLRGNSLQEFTSHGTHKRGLIFQDMMRCAKIARFKSQRHVYVSFNLYFLQGVMTFKALVFSDEDLNRYVQIEEIHVTSIESILVDMSGI